MEHRLAECKYEVVSLIKGYFQILCSKTRVYSYSNTLILSAFSTANKSERNPEPFLVIRKEMVSPRVTRISTLLCFQELVIEKFMNVFVSMLDAVSRNDN